MSKITGKFLEKHPEKVFYILLTLALPAFFTNLGLLPLFGDEPTRASVALEMILSKNFSVPTIGNEHYYNKPPFYNWILVSCYQLTGNFSEFSTRLPAIVPLFLFVITIFYSVARFLKDKRIALLSSMLFLLNSRMLLYESMLGHIDIFFSWLCFSSFMLIFYFYQEKKWFLLFFSSYLITAVTFLCKGIPALVFQGFTLLALLTYSKNLKRLISWQHILSGLMCLLIIGSYFYNFSKYNSNLQGYLEILWDQSSQRTVAVTGFRKTINYFITFPFVHAGHLFPASMLLLFCFHKGFKTGILHHPFLKFIAIAFLANIWIYWLSPETRPRYLLMLYPLLIITASHAYYTYRDEFPRLNGILNKFLLFITILLALAVPAALFAGIIPPLNHPELKVAFVFIVLAFLTWFIWQINSGKLIAFMAVLIVVRLGFSWFVLPGRVRNDNSFYRSAAIEAGKLSGRQPLYLYQYHPEVDALPFHHRLIFYLERTRMQAVNFAEADSLPAYYFTFDRKLNNPKAILLKEYRELKLYRVP